MSTVTANKHSTGGVGDTIALPVAPLVTAFGVAVPQLSGRGLGHTGGTLDKLESIPGWQADVTNERMMEILEDPGCIICAARAGLAPADKKIHVLRDTTSTVESIPLIASSITSVQATAGIELRAVKGDKVTKGAEALHALHGDPGPLKAFPRGPRVRLHHDGRTARRGAEDHHRPHRLGLAELQSRRMTRREA